MHDSVPMAILGVCGVVGGLSVLFLPETGNAPLKATLKNEENNIKTISESTFNKQNKIAITYN